MLTANSEVTRDYPDGMAVPALELHTSPAVDTDADLLVLGVTRGADGPELAAPEGEYPELRAILASIGATGAADELRRAPAVDGSRAPSPSSGSAPP